jgi:TIR domain
MKIFISHSSVDKPFVRKLKRDLELNYIDTWTDEDELQIGDSLIDKLSRELQNSSHFLIVLSPNSIKSEWVKYELDNALKYLEEETLRKIIPIHYRDCKIPDSIKYLLNIDLTKETVYFKNGDFEFFGGTYYCELNKLLRNLQKDAFRLNENDKNSLLSKNVLSNFDENTISFHFKIIGYKSISNFLANQIPVEVKSKYTKSLENFVPIILPIQLKQFFSQIKFGDTINFKNKDNKSIVGQFAKFSSNNNLCIPKGLREFLGVKTLGVHKLILTIAKKTMKIEEAKDN